MRSAAIIVTAGAMLLGTGTPASAQRTTSPSAPKLTQPTAPSPAPATSNVVIEIVPAVARLCRVSGDGPLPECGGDANAQPSERFQAEWPLGTVVVRGAAAGYETREITFDVARGVPQRVLFTLAVERVQATGTITVQGADGAQLYLDGQPFGTSPVRDHVIAAGPHHIMAERRGDKAWMSRIVIPANSGLIVTLELSPRRAHGSWLGAWGAGGAGIVSLAVGALLGSMAMEDQARFNDAPTQDVADDGRARAVAADVMMGLGVGALGVSAWLFHRSVTDPSTARIEQAAEEVAP